MANEEEKSPMQTQMLDDLLHLAFSPGGWNFFPNECELRQFHLKHLSIFIWRIYLQHWYVIESLATLQIAIHLLHIDFVLFSNQISLALSICRNSILSELIYQRQLSCAWISPFIGDAWRWMQFHSFQINDFRNRINDIFFAQLHLCHCATYAQYRWNFVLNIKCYRTKQICLWYCWSSYARHLFCIFSVYIAAIYGKHIKFLCVQFEFSIKFRV